MMLPLFLYGALQHLYTDIFWKNCQYFLRVGGFNDFLCTPSGKTRRLTRNAMINLLRRVQLNVLGQKTIVAKMGARGCEIQGHFEALRSRSGQIETIDELATQRFRICTGICAILPSDLALVQRYGNFNKPSFFNAGTAQEIQIRCLAPDRHCFDMGRLAENDRVKHKLAKVIT